MEIVVCVKPVPDAETRLRARADGNRLDEEGVKFVLAGYDESAVEQALLLKEAGAASRVRVLACGPGPRAEEVLRSAIALGCDAATLAELPSGAGIDQLGVAQVLAMAVGRAPHDLVLLGKQAGDDEAGIVGPALAELLHVANFSAVTDLRWDAGAAMFIFQVAAEGGSWKTSAPAPLVISLQQAWNDPRTARLPNILKSRRAAIERIPAAEVLAALGERASRFARPSGFQLPPPRTGAKLIEAKTPEESAEKLVRILQEDVKVLP